MFLRSYINKIIDKKRNFLKEEDKKVWIISFDAVLKDNIDLNSLPFHLQVFPYLMDMINIKFEKCCQYELPEQPTIFYGQVNDLKGHNNQEQLNKIKNSLQNTYGSERQVIVLTDFLEYINGGIVYDNDLTVAENESDIYREILNSFSNHLSHLFFKKTKLSVFSKIKTYFLFDESKRKKWYIQ